MRGECLATDDQEPKVMSNERFDKLLKVAVQFYYPIYGIRVLILQPSLVARRLDE